jgi:methionine-rich copper-binding protein CopC
LVALSVALPALITDTAPAEFDTIEPGDGAILAAPPDTVSLRFTGDFVPSQVHVAVATATGTAVRCGEPVVDGQTVRTPVAATGDGVYLIAYHVVLGDGRDLSGLTRYTVDSHAPAGAVPAGAVPASPPDRAPEGEPAGGHAHGDDPVSIALTIAATLLIVALVALLVRRPRLRS